MGDLDSMVFIHMVSGDLTLSKDDRQYRPEHFPLACLGKDRQPFLWNQLARSILNNSQGVLLLLYKAGYQYLLTAHHKFDAMF